MPQFNADHNDYEPCDTCLTIITELVAGYDADVYTELDDDYYDGVPTSFLPGWVANDYEEG